MVASLIRSSQSGERVALTTTFESSGPLTEADRDSYIGSEGSNA